MKPDRSGAGRRDPREMRESMEISPDFDMDMESILDSAHEHQPAEKQVDADFFNGERSNPLEFVAQSALRRSIAQFWSLAGEMCLSDAILQLGEAYVAEGWLLTPPSQPLFLKLSRTTLTRMT